MLRKLLPKLSLGRRSNPITEGEAPNPQIHSSPNLLDMYGTDPAANSHFISQATSSLKLFILIIPAVFLVSLFINDVTDWRIGSTKKTIERLNIEILDYNDTAAEANKIIQKIEIYKQARADHPRIASKMEFLLTNVPQDVVISEIRYQDGNLEVKAKTPRALNLALLIDNYFKDKSISEIILRSASYDQRDGLFTSEVGVVYK